MRRDMQFIEEWNQSHSCHPRYEDVIEWADRHPSDEVIRKVLAIAEYAVSPDGAHLMNPDEVIQYVQDHILDMG